jgi:uncharacterized protein (TIGR02145 family)
MKKIALILFLAFSMMQSYGQDYLISFTGSGLSSTVDSVWVINLIRNDSLLIGGQDTLHLKPNVGITETEAGKHKITIFPNPMSNASTIAFFCQFPGSAHLEIFDIAGKSLIQTNQMLSQGWHSFEVSGLNSGVYLVKVNTGEHFSGFRLVSIANLDAKVNLKYLGAKGEVEFSPPFKNTNTFVEMLYYSGERIVLKGMSGEHARVITMIPNQNEAIDFEFIECMDFDGNHYPVVTIGDQTWMAENLAYLPSVSPSVEGSETMPHFYVYDFEGTNVDDAKATENYRNYGVLYNLSAAKSACPQGWHLPGDAEWSQLLLFLDPNANPNMVSEPESYIAGGNLKSTLTSPVPHPRWDIPNSEAFNSAGFSGFPGGYRSGNNFFNHLGYTGMWWSATHLSNNVAWNRAVTSLNGEIFREQRLTSTGLSVRCVLGSGPQSIEPEGAGTETNPYLIQNLGNLYWMSVECSNGNNFTGKYFLQIANIDASPTVSWFEGAGWEPIHDFHGFYDGQDHVIESLHINRPLDYYVGLFGIISGAKITNLRIENADITGFRLVAGLAGQVSEHSYISYIIVENINLNIINRHGGGVAGYVDNSSVFRCASSGEITRGNNYDWNSIGGLIGYIINSTVVNECFSTANVTSAAHNTYGGLIGSVAYGCEVNNSYARGSVIGSNAMAGGLIGELYNEANLGQVENCFSTGLVSAPGDYVGGFLGHYTQSNCIENFWDIQASNQASSPCATGLTTVQMKTQSTFINAGWDFEQIWNKDGVTNDGYPFLRWQTQLPDLPSVITAMITDITDNDAIGGGTVVDEGSSVVTARGLVWSTSENPTLESNLGTTIDGGGWGAFDSDISELTPSTVYYVRAYATNSFGTFYGGQKSFITISTPLSIEPEGLGTEANPYLIQNLGNLYWMSVECSNGNNFDGKHFLQIANIDASPTVSWFEGKGWKSIHDFHGSYDGQGHVIESLHINRPLDYNVGLFGLISGARITDVRIENADITGFRIVGGLASQVFENSYISYIIVENINLNIINRHGGGVAGYVDNSSVFRCSSSGEITRGNNYDWNSIGGLIGYIINSAVVNECFSTANVTSAAHNTYGGLIGSVALGCEVNNSYARGSVIGANAMAGGLIGELYNEANLGQVENCFSTGLVSAPGGYVGGFLGHYTQSNCIENFWDIQASNQASSPCATGLTTVQMKTQSTFINAGWDFEQIWDIDGVINDGYPFLRWQIDSRKIWSNTH